MILPPRSARMKSFLRRSAARSVVRRVETACVAPSAPKSEQRFMRHRLVRIKAANGTRRAFSAVCAAH